MELRHVCGVALAIFLAGMIFYTLSLVAQSFATIPAINISEEKYTQHLEYYHDPPLGFSYIVMIFIIVIGVSSFYWFTTKKGSGETKEKQ